MRHPASSIALKETGRDPHKLKRYCVVDHTRRGDKALNLIDGVFQRNAETVNCGPATDPPICPKTYGPAFPMLLGWIVIMLTLFG
jgi:hypothetical protein